jgi:CRISPR/Cas system-associated protein Cas10 (large subunit of type III CRISPR-Cas system)
MATVIGQDRREAEALERLWGWRTCDHCGSTIMLGEATLASRDGAGHLCLACAEAPDEPRRETRKSDLQPAGRSR